MEAIILRPYCSRDYSGVAEIWAETGQNPFTPQEIERLLKSQGGALIAEDPETKAIVGTALWNHNGRMAFLWRVAVTQDYRKKGIAAQLIGRIEKETAEAGFIKIGLITNATNKPARNLYAKLGYRIDEGDEYWFRNLTTEGDCGC